MKINYSKIINRQNHFINFIERCKYTWFSLNNIHNIINIDDTFNEFKIYYNNLKIKNDELDIKLLINNNSNMSNKKITHNVISRFLANELVISILKKYPEKFNKDLEVYKKTSDESVKKNLKENMNKYPNPYKKINFIEDIKIDKDIFKKEELNQILDILFFIKDEGNITAILILI